ncbi:FGGY family carbohydrate kinase [Streptomyces sp. NPDC049954]|uniref:FGGY family carbohydrate kinase n=1 Tax=Streptomyces sp. NPDC049954 TaxID=3155779 RepID=UPI0034410406
MTTILSIDQGTSGTKAVLTDERLEPLAVALHDVRPRYLPGGGVEQDPAALLASVLGAGRQAVAEAGRAPDVVALANQGETVLAWDPDTGRPLSPAIVWQDRRAGSVTGPLAPRAAEVAARTGLPLDPYFSAPKMAWLRAHVTTGGVVTTTDSWLLHHLTGAFVTDVTTASRSLLLDIDRLDWDEDLLGLFGLDGERLPRLVRCDEPVGTTSAFGPPATVAGLVVDQQAALLAEGCLTPSTAKCTYGTGAFLLANTGAEAVRSAGGLALSCAWRTAGESAYCLDGQVYTAGSAVRWLTDMGLLASAADLDTAAAGGSGGALCVPAFAGLAAPWWSPGAGARFEGLALATRPGHLVAAVLEGIAAQVATLCATVARDTGAPIGSLRADGGLTRSRALLQAQADLAQIPVEVHASEHATALGAAALARLALDPGLGLAGAAPAGPPSAVVTPRWSADRAADHLARWQAAAGAASAASPHPAPYAQGATA